MLNTVPSLNVFFSVADPDPNPDPDLRDPSVFGPHGSEPDPSIIKQKWEEKP